MRLNLGCADRSLPGYVGVDIAPGTHVSQVVDLAGPWPWADSSVESVQAYDVIEHVGDCDHVRTYCDRCTAARAGIRELVASLVVPIKLRHPIGRIHFLNELHRVLKPGACAVIETPNAAHGVGFFQDPTHVSPFCMSTFRYFEHGAYAQTRLAKSYGITAAFKVLDMREYQSSAEGFGELVWKIKCTLEAVK